MCNCRAIVLPSVSLSAGATVVICAVVPSPTPYLLNVSHAACYNMHLCYLVYTIYNLRNWPGNFRFSFSKKS